MIKDSGERTEFRTGAVRDIQEGKGKCDLMPLNEIGTLLDADEILLIESFRVTGEVRYLYACLREFANRTYKTLEEMILDVSKHFEEGMKKYGMDNWKKGINLRSYVNSGIRHYLKFRANITDEPHDRAFVWNILCAIWTKNNKPELDDFTEKKEATVQDVIEELLTPYEEKAMDVSKAISELVAKDHAEHFWERR